MTGITRTGITRRHFVALGLAGITVPLPVQAATPREISWDDLIPPGVPYADIIGEGERDEVRDYWRPVYDENATKLNAALDGALVRLPGFVVPLELGATGTTEFILVPYVGACIHVPPPPPNQLVLVNTPKPWPGDRLWEPVWVEGQMRTRLTATDIAETGYALAASNVELYEW